MREPQGNAIRASRTAGPVRASSKVDHRRGVIVATVAALLMTFTGAFGTGQSPLLWRALYWLVVMEAGALMGIGATTGVRAWGRFAGRPWIEGALVSLAIAAPLTLVVLAANIAFYGDRAIRLFDIGFLFVAVWIVTGAITAINYATSPAGAVVPIAPLDSPPAAPQRPRLAERLSPHLRDAAIHALQAEDHYLRVHTDAGSELILMRMGDAIPELAGVEGARTHRSWWVARESVRQVERKDGRAELRLAGGLVAPVSRSAYPELRDAGWFG